MLGQNQICAIDTSSLLAVRESFGKTKETKVFATLSGYAEKGFIVFPPQVREELERAEEAETDPDPPLLWVQMHRERSERTPSLEAVRRVLTVVPELLDADSPHEPADAYVVALAAELRDQGFDARVITDDKRDRLPLKVSPTTAASVLKLLSQTLYAFLKSDGTAP